MFGLCYRKQKKKLFITKVITALLKLLYSELLGRGRLLKFLCLNVSDVSATRPEAIVNRNEKKERKRKMTDRTHLTVKDLAITYMYV